MTSQQQFKDRFLSKFSSQSPGEELLFTTGDLAMENRIHEPYVRELLVQWAKDGLISLEAWDGKRRLPWDEWPTLKGFFFNRSGGGRIMVKLLAGGAEYVELISKNKIGFTA